MIFSSGFGCFFPLIREPESAHGRHPARREVGAGSPLSAPGQGIVLK
jgi:hypothetical protein